MKKKMKYFLLGAGTVVAGFLAYAFLSDSQMSCKETSQAPQDPPADPPSPRCSSQDYVAHRREFMQKRAAERAATESTEEPSVPQPAPQPVGPAQEPSADEPADLAGDSREGILPAQEEHPAPETPGPAADPEGSAETEGGEAAECLQEPVSTPTDQDAEMQDTEQEQAEGTEPEEHGEDPTK